MELKNFQNILDNDFNIGFEIECLIFRQQNANFEKAVMALHKGILFVYDGSVRAKGWSRKRHNTHTYANRHNLNIPIDQAHEILTPVLPAIEAVQLLEKIFALVAEFGYTTKCCGLHANFSPRDKKNHGKINPFFLVEQPVWKEARKTFNRIGNKYCQDVVLRKDIRENPANILKQKINKDNLENGMFFWDGYRDEEVSINYKHINAISLWRYLVQLQDFKRFGKQKLVKCHFHYGVVNLENYKPRYTMDSRIEIRAMGGDSYHFRLLEIVDYCDKTLELIKESYNHKIKI